MTRESGVRILLVEDSRTQAEALRIVLESGGFLVETAASVGAALARLAHGAIDFIVSDIVMPGASGYDLCREVKRDPRLRPIPVLLLTSLREPIDVIHALESGADSFLNKSCEPDRRLMTPAADSLQHPLEVDAAGDVPVLHVDPELLRRVLQNLVDNALRHSPPGTPVRLEVQASGHEVHVRVRDQGSGVPPDMREHIFDKYVRLPGAQGESSTFGKGLGLAFCRIAIEAHGGRIRVEDNAPRGSVFVVSLPAGDRTSHA